MGISAEVAGTKLRRSLSYLLRLAPSGTQGRGEGGTHGGVRVASRGGVRVAPRGG